jgi:outer membrane cobalamin receptor
MKKIILTILIIACYTWFFSQNTVIQNTDSASFFNLSLEELLNVEISVASKTALTLRESPGIVTLITRDEIRNSGAHDLMEVLSMVPGLHFGVDVEGVVGIGVRGNWGHEGKVLLLYDGQEMNEQLYSTVQFGEHYPIDQIKKIEIIRGPGSGMYGGNAEYAVINIITNNNPEYEGLSVAATYGQMQRTLASRSISLNGGKHFGNLAVNVGAYAGEGNRSDRIFTDYSGNSFDMASESRLRNCLLNFSTNYKGLSFRFLGDYYMNENRSGYDHILIQTEPLKFNSSFWDLHYNWKISNKFSIVPQLKYKEQTPWKVDGIVSPDDIQYYKDAKKPSGNITLHYLIRKNLKVDGGAEYYIDQAFDHSEGGTFSNGKNTINYYNTAIFMHGLWSNKIANLTVGARYHENNGYRPSFVPSIGLTKVIRKAHFKALYSTAFRTPSIENIHFGNNIQPEKTNVAELETGFQFSNNSYLTANLFDITTCNAIVYYYDDGDGYHNSGSTGTRGFEIDYKFKNTRGYADFNVAYYTARGKEKTENYVVPGNSDMLLAFPGIVANGLVNIRLNDRISLNPSLSWIGRRYEIAGIDAEGNNIFKKCKPELIANVFAGLQQLKVKGLSASIGCANIFNAKNRFIQPYNSNHAPLPGRSREFRFTLRYDLDQNKK